jgi:hypothetical protein
LRKETNMSIRRSLVFGAVAFALTLSFRDASTATGAEKSTCPVDQTSEENRRLAAQDANTKGTAIFSNEPIESRDHKPDPSKTVLKRDVTYREAQEIGSRAYTWKWIALRKMSFEQLQKNRTIEGGPKPTEHATQCCSQAGCNNCCPDADLCRCFSGGDGCSCECD